MQKVKPKSKNPVEIKRQLAAEWQALLAKHSAPLERGAKAKGVKSKPKTVVFVAPSTVSVESSRDLTAHPSLDTGLVAATKKEAPRYTGDKMLGIGTMHKSSSVPIFSTDEAEAIAKMRRN